MIRAIVFDIGGVLEYTLETDWVSRWSRQFGLSVEQFNTVLNRETQAGMTTTLNEADLYQQLADTFKTTTTQILAMMNDMWQEYLGTLNVELDAYFRSLRPRFKTAILSNSFTGARERETAAYQFDQACDMILYSHEIGLLKPDPRIYALLCERLECQPLEIIFLDDVEQNVRTACEHWIHGIQFQDNQQAINAIEKTIFAASGELERCPICRSVMQPDLIFEDGTALNDSQISSHSANVKGYGFFCPACQQAWTGNELFAIHRSSQD
ncbi:MAG: HAD family phosphatase [Herpetosiphon sp.]|nr:HAD family phosphatase [Herpetosiphon sp.]